MMRKGDLMSTFSGRVGRGAMRAHRTKLGRDAYERQLAIWNDGTGFLSSGKHVVHPYNMLPVALRPKMPWPIPDEEFPDLGI